jgi:RHS repeat-associated protein
VWGITYDKLGNIKTTQRNGMTNSDLMNPTFGQIDNMTYTYTGTSKLSGITDVSSSTKGFKAASSGYAHDAVGNLTGDSGKGLTAGYNFLDLPHTITTSTGSVTIVYDANGKKLKQTVVQGGTTEVWHYLDGIEFKNGARHAINHEEGRIVYNEPLPMPGGGNQNYREWFLKDHLGNTRVRFVDKDQDGLVDLNGTNPQVHEITGAYHYYPFGMELEGDFNRQQAHINRYKYNGKEWSDVSGWYEYGFRYYDPVIGRFTGVDPIAEKFPDISGFNYASNNPVANIDLHGLQGTSAVVNFKAGSPAGNLEALTKAITRSNEARLCPFKGKSIGGKIGLAIGMMMIHGDNPTRQQRQDSNDKALTRNLENGDFESFQQRISSWNKNNPNDRMVFRYLSSSELENASLNLEDGSSYLINLNRKGQFDEKYITPDLYIEGETAKKMLALPGPDSPDFAIWSYEDDILRTKEPPGTGVYSTVKADNGQPGGGKEAKIMQPFPIRGLFPIR